MLYKKLVLHQRLKEETPDLNKNAQVVWQSRSGSVLTHPATRKSCINLCNDNDDHDDGDESERFAVESTVTVNAVKPE